MNIITDLRYRTLRMISTIYQIIAYLSLAAGILGLVPGFIYSRSDFVNGSANSFTVLAVGTTLCLICLTVSQVIRLFIDIESNTKLNNVLIQKMVEGKLPASQRDSNPEEVIAMKMAGTNSNCAHAGQTGKYCTQCGSLLE